MVSSLQPSMQEFLNDVNRIAAEMSQAQTQLSTGLKVNVVSDSPDVVSPLLQAQANLSTAQQVTSNLGMVTTEVNTGEQSLESAVSLYDQVQTLSAEGASSTQTASGQADIAQQVQSIEQQMVGLANTSVNGRFIFSGDTDQTQPYTYDPTQPDPVSAYQGSASTRTIQSATGTTFPVALTAQQIFDSTDPTTNVFTSINNLVTALQSGSTTAIATANSALPNVATYLNTRLAFYGTAQDAVTAATTSAATLTTQLQTQISGIQDADETQSILDLTQAQTQQQAALESFQQIPQTSLFNYLG
ncbi:MAG: flagellin [Bryobacteraceae bacterium]|jgi:flagellar hook-associated protein 3 FlgL